MVFSLSDGKEFVKVARRSIEYSIHTNSLLQDRSPKKEYEEKMGVFVTLHSYPSNELRGCIGFPEPIKQLWQAIIEAASSAAFNDPRFMSLEAGELDKVIVEVSVLTKPEKIEVKKQEELLKKIEIGKDGLIAEQGMRRGLLLPQVAPEWNWNVEQFLEHTCEKAGLPKDAWKEKNTIFYKFQTQVFTEESPKGQVKEVDLKTNIA